ncbi:CAP domain-containing protein [Paracoccus sp. CPCC 101403]|uniref:CAP domain-containing protein n=1 Tax=Paracoccus broussonetiae TaxID=3075834 RepID=A0ABU3E7T8_9RHOB|nr:CAP domain-containing protein [Paracoccus sp. CPCC 101403]MDT1060258.1 CAP domain-containing protein [Paracoccus sp. CPCC 101403]
MRMPGYQGRVALTMVLFLPLACTQTAGTISYHAPGYPDVQASAPGRAECRATSSEQNAAAAARTNATRRAHGLPALRSDPRLARAAAAQACDMARRGTMTHSGSHSSGPMQRAKAQGYAPRIAAENIAAGPYDLTGVLSVWAGSRGHVDNILIPQLQDFGIGSAVGADGRTVFWSAVYAAPR